MHLIISRSTREIRDQCGRTAAYRTSPSPIWLGQSGCKRQQHPRLGPAHIGSSNGREAKDAVVKEASLIPHMIHGPLQDLVGQGQACGIQILEFGESNNALRHGMNVDRISPIVEIFGGAVFAKEMGAIEFEPSPDRLAKLSGVRVEANRPQGPEIETRVKIVDPLLLGPPAIFPGPV